MLFARTISTPSAATAWLTILAWAAIGCTAPPPGADGGVVTNQRFDPVKEKIQRLIEDGKIPSMAVAVAENGKVIWQEAFGWADVESRVPATPRTIYGLASISKSLTAMAVMVLVERGKIDLDAPVNRYLAPPGLRAYEGEADAATVRHVLNMNAGIPHGGLYYEPAAAGLALTPEEWLRRHGVIVFPPGEIHEYSNFSSGVAELAVEQVSGERLGQFLRDNVFGPLRMTDTGVVIDEKNRHRLAAHYRTDLTRFDPGFQLPLGAAGFYSTAHDLLRYAMAHLKTPLPDQERVLSDETIDRMHDSYDAKLPRALHALGWFSIGLGGGLRQVVTNGSMGGVNSHLTLLPDRGIAVVALTNVTSPDAIADTIAGEVAELMVPGFVEAARRFREGFFADYIEKPYEPFPQIIGRWSGGIRTHELGKQIEIRFDDDGTVVIRLETNDPVTLEQARFNAGRLEGSFTGTLPYEDALQSAETIDLTLELRDDRLFGYAMANYASADEERPYRFFLPAYVGLERLP